MLVLCFAQRSGSKIFSHPVLVYDVSNNVQLAILLAVVDNDNPANLDIPLERHRCGMSLFPAIANFERGFAAA